MANGVLWNTLFDGDEINIRKGLFGSMLIRDYNLSQTSLTGFSPFSPTDGNLINTLFSPSNPGGQWYDLGYLDEKGPEFTPKLKTELTQVYQSRRPARADYTGDEEEITATLMESTPLVEYLVQNKPLSSDIPVIGSPDFAVGRPLELDILYRQLLVIMVDGSAGSNYYKVRLYPRVVLTKLGRISSNPRKVYSIETTFESFPDPYTVSPDGVAGAPVITFEDGPAWRAQGAGTAWPVPQVAPVATATTGSTATVVFAEPSTPNTPFTYEVFQTTGAVTSLAALSGTPVTTGGNVTATVSGLTVGDDYTFFVVATGTNGSASVPSEASNSITAIS